MSRTQSMLSTHPRGSEADVASQAKLVDAVRECAQVCTTCADACLNEDDPKKLATCIRTNLDCAAACAATARIGSRLTQGGDELLRAQVEACAVACRVCAEECEKHAGMHEHCKICAEACRECEETCRDALSALAAAV